MKKSFLLIVLFIMCLVSCKSSHVRIGDKNANYIPYYLKVYEADSLYLIGKYEKSYEILNKLFKKYEPVNLENYNEYSTYIVTSILSKKTKLIEDKIKKVYTDFGGFGVMHSKSDSIYSVISPFLNPILSNSDSIKMYKTEYEKKINLDLREKIKKMSDEDQSARTNYDFEKMKFFEEKHKIEIEDIILRYGYPNYKIIGIMGYNKDETDKDFEIVRFHHIFLHQSIDFKKKYLPSLFENVKTGKFSPSEYASIYDKMIWEKSILENGQQIQLYGSFHGLKIIDTLNINKLRKSIGLPSLGYEIWRNNQIYTNKIN